MNSIDASVSKSYTADYNSEILLEVNLYQSINSINITGGTLYLKKGTDYSIEVNETSDVFTTVIKTNEFGLGIHYFTLIFSKNGYQPESVQIAITVNKLAINATIIGDKTILQEPEKEFTVQIKLLDPATNQPVENAKVTYAWIYGSGEMTDEGNGIYSFTEIAPLTENTYTITIITHVGDYYESEEIEITLVTSMSSNGTSLPLEWLILIGGVALLVIGGLTRGIYKQKVVIPRQRNQLLTLKDRVQVFEDLENLSAVLFIQKQSGILFHKYVLRDKGTLDDNLFTGFLHAIMLFSNQYSGEDPSAIKEDTNMAISDLPEYERLKSQFPVLEFTHQSFNILVDLTK